MTNFVSNLILLASEFLKDLIPIFLEKNVKIPIDTD